MTSFNRDFFSGLISRNRAIVVLIVSVLLFYVFGDAVSEIVVRVTTEERYGHAPLVLLVALYLIWLRRFEINDGNSGAWWGIPVVLLAGIFLLIGDLSAIWTIVQYALVLLIVGLIWTLIGRQIKKIAIPLLLLFLTIPLPYMLDVMLSGKMQLLSSQIGVEFIRLLGISVFLEGNVIDLGQYRLQVVEACSGLNYMFPLMTIGLMMAYVFRAPLLVRGGLFASTVPISILMNSFRISIVAVLVNHYGNSAAEGFMHFFEGWVVFIVCIALLLLEIKLYLLVTGSKLAAIDALDVRAVTGPAQSGTGGAAFFFTPVILVLVTMLLIVAGTFSIGKRDEVIPARMTFAEFPMQIEQWAGHSYQFMNDENRILRLTDYLLADYSNGKDSVNVYLGYTESQRRGFVPHSPKACIPGGGWEISDTSIRPISLHDGQQVRVTRMVIRRGADAQIVYYWFRQRGRDLSNEYSMKLALVYDAIKLRRTDGAIVRFTMPVTSSMDDVDAKLQQFIGLAYPKLPAYIPD